MGIQVSGGAACAARLAQPSHVYRAMGLSEPEAACVLRFSPGRSTTAEEIRAAADAVVEVYHRRR
jgi:cysteine desulfurase